MTRIGPALVVAMGVLAAGPASATPFVLARTLANPRATAHDFFGASVAFVEADALVGAYFEDTSAADAGAAYLFDAASGALVRTFSPLAAGPGERFGNALAATGSLAVIAAPDRDSGAPHAGAVYLVESSSALVRTLTAPAPAFGDSFGFALSVSGQRLVIGAPYDSRGAHGAGAVYVFDVDTGVLLRTLLHPEPRRYDLFGRALAAAGATVVVGAPLRTEGSHVAGIAYLIDADSGVLLHTLRSPSERPGQFGAALATDGSTVLVGAPRDDAGGVAAAGAAYLFDATGGHLLQTLVSPKPSTDGRFGTAVALTASLVFVGAPAEDTGATDAGAVHVFDRESGLLLDTVDNPAPAVGDQFGASLATAGSQLLVGAWLDDAPVQNAGRAYLFVDSSAPPTTTSTTTTTTTSMGPASTTTTQGPTTSTTEGPTTTTAEPTTSTTEAPTTTTEVPPTSTTEVPTTTTIVTQPSTTTETLAAPTTTSTAPELRLACTPDGCADGDLCTVDSCDAAGHCRHDLPASPETVVCRLRALRAAFHAFAPPDRARRAALAPQRRLLARVDHQVAIWRQKPRVRLRSATRTLEAFARATRRAARAGVLSTLAHDRLIVLTGETAHEIGRLRALFAAPAVRSRATRRR